MWKATSLNQEESEPQNNYSKQSRGAGNPKKPSYIHPFEVITGQNQRLNQVFYMQCGGEICFGFNYVSVFKLLF